MSPLDTSQTASLEHCRNGKNGHVNGIVFQRYEYKYTIPAALMAPIQNFLRPYCAMDSYAAREPDQFYTITTLYLDSDRYKTYWDKEEEVPARFKLRVRTYGVLSDGPVKFEVKRRFNEVFRKTRVGIPSEKWPSLLTGPAEGLDLQLGPSEKTALGDFLRLVHTLRAKPKVLVRYQRQAFISRIDRYVRISFDRRLRYQPANTYDLKGLPDCWRATEDPASPDDLGAKVILELKFMTRAPVWLVDLVRTFGLMRRGFSKYCFAVRGVVKAETIGRELAQAVATAGGGRRR